VTATGTFGGSRSTASAPPGDPIAVTSEASPGPDGSTPAVAGQEIGPAAYLARTGLVVVSVLTIGMALFLTVIGGLEHQVLQAREYSHFRAALAAGTAPTGQTDSSGRHLLPLGTAVALLQIPSIHLDEVVGEGTTPQVLLAGPGHRRDTPLPGQPGTSVVVGREAAYGGPFKRIHQLKVGTTIRVTVGFGTNVATFKVIDVRHAGDPRPPDVGSGAGRLTLVTAAGTPFLPNGLVYVDADLQSRVQPASARVITSPSQLMRSEVAGATDTSSLWVLVFWLQALLLVTFGAVWSWHRWGHAQTWVVFVPLVLVVGFFVSDQVTRLLPNVL
jgi:LPXTG-site transpeptidase (sortase) family protein